MGGVQREWQDVDYVLALFDGDLPSARSAYRQYVQDGITLGRRKDLVGGGLVRSQGRRLGTSSDYKFPALDVTVGVSN
jgi:hypothetical protein